MPMNHREKNISKEYYVDSARAIVIQEANLPLTEKRVFEAKLKGRPLCITRGDLINHVKFLVDNKVLALDVGYQLDVLWSMLVWDMHEGDIDHINKGQKYLVPYE